MKPKLLIRDLLLFTFLAGGVAAQVQKSGPSPSDALFDPSRVIQIEIRLDPKDWHALRVSHPVIDETGNISATEKGYDYYRGDIVIDGQVVKSVGVRKKGAWGSTVSSRPALKIKLDEYVKDQEFSGLDMLTLNNCVSDPTKAQQFLIYSFMSKAGALAPRSNLALVVVNGEDLGVYANVESIRKPFIKRFFTGSNGDLYESSTGGSDLTTNRVHRLVHKWGKDTQLVQLRKLVDVLEQPGPVSLSKVEELVDLDSFITFWAAEVLSGCHDGYAAFLNNYYLYCDAGSGKIFFIPWGRDVAFRDPGFLPDTVPKSVKAFGYLCQRLWELPEIRERYRREMRRLLADVWDEKTLLSELERMRSLCQDDRSRQPARAQERADIIVRFVEGRRKEVQAELDGPAPEWHIPRRNPPAKSNHPSNPPMLVEGSFSAVTVERYGTNLVDLLGHGSATLQYTLGDKTHAPFTQFGARATIESRNQDILLVRIAALNHVNDHNWILALRIDPYCLSGKFKINTTAFAEEKKP